MPSSRQLRRILKAISPRLAISTLPMDIPQHLRPDLGSYQRQPAAPGMVRHTCRYDFQPRKPKGCLDHADVVELVDTHV